MIGVAVAIFYLAVALALSPQLFAHVDAIASLGCSFVAALVATGQLSKLLSKAGLGDPAKRMLAGWAVRVLASCCAVALAATAGAVAVLGVSWGRWPWAATLVLVSLGVGAVGLFGQGRADRGVDEHRDEE